MKNKYKQIIPYIIFITLFIILFSYFTAGGPGEEAYSQETSIGSNPLLRPLAISSEDDEAVCSLDSVVCPYEAEEKAPLSAPTIKSMSTSASDGQIQKQIIAIAKEQNFKWPDYLLKLAYCESRFNPKARNNNGRYGMDRGLFQINNKYHPQITDKQADDVRFATLWTMEKINKGYQHLWSCDKMIKS